MPATQLFRKPRIAALHLSGFNQNVESCPSVTYAGHALSFISTASSDSNIAVMCAGWCWLFPFHRERMPGSKRLRMFAQGHTLLGGKARTRLEVF